MITYKDIVNILKPKEVINIDSFLESPVSFSIDSRSIKENDCFVALKGQNSDGHLFINQAFESGSQAAILEDSKKDIIELLNPVFLKNKIFIFVKNTKEALFFLAKQWRLKFKKVNIVAITGTCGKTTTKNFLTKVLSKISEVPCSVLSTEKNLNSEYGVALTLLKLNNNHEAAVIEAGISKTGDMDILADMIRPDFALITSIGQGHLEGLIDVDNVFKEKMKICKFFKTDKNVLFFNSDSYLFNKQDYNFKIFFIGSNSEDNDFFIKDSRQDIENNNFYLLVENKIEDEVLDVSFLKSECLQSEDTFMVPGVLIFNTLNYMHAFNGLMVYAFVLFIKLSIEKKELHIFFKLLILMIKRTISEINLDGEGRFNVSFKDDHSQCIVKDAYNANPTSMQAGINSFLKLTKESSKRLFVLGSMLELGNDSDLFHEKLSMFLKMECPNSSFIFVGKDTKVCLDVLKKKEVYFFEKINDDLLGLCNDFKKRGYSVFIKGSHGTGLYKLSESLNF